jgi:hypothetical protein
LAVREQVPDATIVRVVPETVQTDVSDDVTTGVTPEVAVTVSEKGVLDHVRAPGFVNEIVLLAWLMVTVVLADEICE